jgi:hypothetical protein
MAPCPPSCIRATEWWVRFALPTLRDNDLTYAAIPMLAASAAARGIPFDISLVTVLCSSATAAEREKPISHDFNGLASYGCMIMHMHRNWDADIFSAVSAGGVHRR